MKKIIFVTNCLVTGGVEKSLYQLISSMNINEYEITIGVLKKGGDFEKQFNQIAKIVELPYLNKSIKELFKYYILKKHMLQLIKAIFYLIRCNLEKNYMKKCVLQSRIYPKFDLEFDYAVCYHKPTDLPVTYTLDNIIANKKILWLHAELDSDELSEYQKVYSKYDKLCVVSESLKKQVINYFPSLESKIVKFLNIIDIESIKKQATYYQTNMCKEYLNIVTVGRLSHEKGQLIIPDVVHILSNNRNINIKWYLIGEGSIKKEIENKISKYNLNNQIVLLGNLENPYPYIKECDIYVQPSLQEGYCLTVKEAMIFKKPIIVTNFLTANELIENNVTGLVTEYSANKIADLILKLYLDEKKCDYFSKNIKAIDTNRNVRKEINNLFEGGKT